MTTPISPCLLAARAPRPRRRVGVAVAVGAGGVAWAVTDEAREAQSGRFSGTASQAVSHAMSIAIGEHGGEATDLQLVMDDAAAAVGVRDLLVPITWLRVYAQAGSLGLDAYDAALTLVAPPTAPAHPRIARRITVATDGSCSRRAMGMAWTTEDGRFSAQATAQGPRCALTAELHAIHLALKAFPYGQSLRLLVDSRSAIHVVEEAQSGHVARAVTGHTYHLATTLTALLRDHDVTVSWVKAHNGHPLNETADRLAVAARRGLELQQPALARDLVFSNIVEDLLRRSDHQLSA